MARRDTYGQRTTRSAGHRGPLVTGLIGALGVALALWSLTDAVANVARTYNPALALRVRPNDPLALAAVADTAFIADPTNPAVRRTSDTIARQALHGSLLNPTAVRLAAMQFESTPRRILVALDTAQRLTRHDVTTQFLLIEANVTQGNVEGALRGYDRILRRKPVMGDTLFPIFANAARDPAVAPAIVTIFAKGAPWAGSFIDWAIDKDTQLATLLPVINAAPANGNGLSPGRKQNIVKQLVALNSYDAAFAAYNRYRSDTPGSLSDFGRPSVYAPLDWEIQDGAGLDGAIDPKTNLFHFALMGEGQGALLRRLVSVKPGAYTLDLTGSISGPSTARVTARVICAAGGSILGTIALRPGKSSIVSPVTVPATCRYVWLSLEGASKPEETAEGFLSRFRLTPTGASRPTATQRP